jgi:hypothetical protein
MVPPCWSPSRFRIELAFGPGGAGSSVIRAGQPKVDRELRDLMRRMYSENPLWGAPRIHGELLKLGYSVAQPNYNATWTRLGLRNDPLKHRPVEGCGRIVAGDILSGLHHQNSRIWYWEWTWRDGFHCQWEQFACSADISESYRCGFLLRREDLEKCACERRSCLGSSRLCWRTTPSMV